jgi:Domain of unknown function (DUF4252)
MRARAYVSAALICLTLSASAATQAPSDAPRVTVPSFADLKSYATESVDITFGPSMLGLMGWLMDDHDEGSASLKKTVQGLRSVQIRSYQFKDDFVYPQADLDRLRAQLSQPGWSQLVKVRNRDTKENVDIYLALQNRTIKGVTIIACGLRAFTIVNVVGSIELDQVEGVRKMFANPPYALAGLGRQAARSPAWGAGEQ